MDKKARKKKARAVLMQAPVAAAAPDNPQLDALLDELMQVRQELLKIDPDSLDDIHHEQWRTQVNQVSLAISKVRNALLAELNAEFAAELPAIETAAGRLTDSLKQLQAANEIIGAIAESIGVVAKILTLLP